MERCLRALVFLGTMLLAASIEAKEVVTDKAAAGLVAQAFEAGLAGDLERRQALLQEAIKASPDYAPAHWQLGHVLHEGKWLLAAEAAVIVGKDERYVEYRTLRDAQWTTAAGQLLLARWCDKQGLVQEAQLHWRGVLTYDPDNAEAIKALGLRKYRNHWLTLEQIEEIKRLEEDWEESRDRWKAKLERWAETIDKDLEGRDEALAQLRAVNDPTAILWLESLVSPVSSELGLEVVSRLAMMDEPAATYSLVRHAVLSEFPEVREAATAELQQRQLDSFVGTLVESLTTPPAFKVTTGYTQAPGTRGFRRHRLDQKSSLSFERIWDEQDLSSEFSLLGALQVSPIDKKLGSFAFRQSDPRLMAKKLAARDRQMQQAVGALEARNVRSCELLQALTGKDFGRDQGKWWAWWMDHVERPAPKVKPVHTERYVGFAGSVFSGPHASCFSADTLVHTKEGLVPIVDIKPGTFVLAQDVYGGELGYRPVLSTSLRPAKKSLIIEVEGDQLDATVAHPFWVTGEGWKLAKQLAVGDAIQGMQGSSPILSIREKPEEMSAYNLVVADFGSYFVGRGGVLVHDNSPVVHQVNALPGMKAE